MSGSTPVAAIDLGTNSCLLLVAHRQGAAIVPVAREMRIVRLGEGLEASGQISPAAMERAVTAILDFKGIIAAHGCQKVRCVATAAFRSASNAGDLQDRINQATGYQVHAVTSRREAQLVLRAVQESFPATTGTRVTVDAGGGSTEIIVESAGDLAGIASLPLGCVHLSERYLSTDPPTAQQLSVLQSHIEHTLDAEALPAGASSMVGVGGTATTFVAMEQAMTTYDHARVHGATATIASLETILQRCIALPLIERQSLPDCTLGAPI